MSNKKQIILNIIMVLLIGIIILSGTMISVNLKNGSEKNNEVAETVSESVEHTEPKVSDTSEDFQTSEQKKENTKEDISDAAESSDDKVLSEEPKETVEDIRNPESTKKVNLTISCASILNNMESLNPGKEAYVPGDGIILSKSFDYIEGESAFSLLKRGCASAGIQLEYAYTPVYGSYYIEGINNLYEFDCGDESGWMYRVNGSFPGYGVDSLILNENDNVEFVYTCNGLGGDLGMQTIQRLYAAPKDNKISASLLWNKSYGNEWSDAPGEGVIVGDYLYIMAKGELEKIDIKTGDTVGNAQLEAAPSFSYTPVTYCDEMIVCPLSNGKIEAFNMDMQPIFTYENPDKGQCLTPVTYSEGKLYTGFWNGETESASYVCIDTNGNLLWSIEHRGGFYWAGAVVIGDFIIFGSDDGEAGSDGTSLIFSLNKNTGEIISQISLENMGDIRSAAVYSENRIYTATKGGYIVSLGFDDNTGELFDLRYKKIGGQITSTPVIYKNRLYFGSSESGFVCADCDTLEKLYTVETPGYPQGRFLLSEKKEGTDLYFYLTYNRSPGGLYCVYTTADSDGDNAVGFEVFTPKDEAGFCISSPIISKDGIIIYKNDSGNIFALIEMEHSGTKEPNVYEPDVPEAPAKPNVPAKSDASSKSEDSEVNEEPNVASKPNVYEPNVPAEQESSDTKAVSAVTNDRIETSNRRIYPWVGLMSASVLGLIAVALIKRKVR